VGKYAFFHIILILFQVSVFRYLLLEILINLIIIHIIIPNDDKSLGKLSFAQMSHSFKIEYNLIFYGKPLHKNIINIYYGIELNVNLAHI